MATTGQGGLPIFAPGAPLLAAAHPGSRSAAIMKTAPVRGRRLHAAPGASGFRSAMPCIDHLTYAVTAGRGAIAVTDTAIGSDQNIDDKVVALFQDFDALKAMAFAAPGHQLWLTSHRRSGPRSPGRPGIPIGGSINLIQASGNRSALAAVSLMLSGHIHSFEAISTRSCAATRFRRRSWPTARRRQPRRHAGRSSTPCFRAAPASTSRTGCRSAASTL